jgi:hypothetical protein
MNRAGRNSPWFRMIFVLVLIKALSFLVTPIMLRPIPVLLTPRAGSSISGSAIGVSLPRYCEHF